jgi:hypothetical protein
MMIQELDPSVFQKEEESFEDYSEEFVTYAVDIYQDFNKVAENFIYGFFCNAELSCGGPIPKKLLFSPDYITLVLNTKAARGIELAHQMIETHNEIADEPIEEMEAIKLVQESLDDFAHSGVPKQLAGGILLMYLELVKGISMPGYVHEKEDDGEL